jgi:hypothetical protein
LSSVRSPLSSVLCPAFTRPAFAHSITGAHSLGDPSDSYHYLLFKLHTLYAKPDPSYVLRHVVCSLILLMEVPSK